MLQRTCWKFGSKP